MKLSQRIARKRPAAALVELALVVSIFFMFLFGILEYCRLVYVREVVINAAREGARYAVVHIYSGALDTDTKAVVKTKMVGLDSQTAYYNCQVYWSDASGANLGSAASASFGQYIAVQIDYDYTPMLPNFLKMNSTIRITSRDLMYSEAN